MDAQLEPCVIERLMGIASRWTRQPTGKYRVFSDKYVQNLCSVGMMSQRGNENQLSWMETDGNEKGCIHECELSCVAYFNESSGYCPSTSNGSSCLFLAENDVKKKNAVKGQLDSSRLIKSLQDYLSGNIWKPHTVDKERKSSNGSDLQSFRFRSRIYMDPDKDVAAHTRCVREKMKCSSSELEDFTATPLLLQGHIDHQRVRYSTPSSNFNDPCLRAMQALKDSRKTSKVSTYDHISFVTSRTCIDKLRHNFSTQKTCRDLSLSVSTLPHPNGLSDATDQVASAVTDDRVNIQDSKHALHGIVFDTLIIPEILTPRSSEDACQHSPVSVLPSSSNAGVVYDSDHLKHVSAELQELRMHLLQLETEFPNGFSGSSVTSFSHNEENKEEVWAQLSNLKHEAMNIMDLSRKELVKNSSWLDLAEEIHAIVTELETLLIDELIEDVIYSQVVLV